MVPSAIPLHAPHAVALSRGRPSHPSKRSLRQCQVTTPNHVIELLWSLVATRRKQVGDVVDLGAGHCQFAFGANYGSYTGIEVDRKKKPLLPLPSNAHLTYADALDVDGSFDVAAGNPPYTKHHLIGTRWQRHARELIKTKTGADVSKLANLYIYFIWLSLALTKADGLVALVTPYEWISRPSAATLREHLRQKKYRVDVYRFEDRARVFKEKTSACILLIDKKSLKHEMHYWMIQDGRPVAVEMARSSQGVLAYEAPTKARAFRGLSPGSQDVFLLTEAERKKARIPPNAVVACVNSLRNLDLRIDALDDAAFKEHYVKAGRKCWLTKTQPPVDPRVRQHLYKAPKKVQENATCRGRKPWYRFDLPPVPDVIYASGFRGTAPRAVVNTIRARVCGSAQGIALPPGTDASAVVSHIRSFPFSERVVPHANGLLKVEVKQMNAVLNGFFTEKVVP